MTEEGARQVVIARRAVELDELLVSQVLHADPALSGERVAGLDNENEAILVERGAHDLRVLQGAHEPERHLLAQDEIEDLLRVAGAHADRDPRVALRESFQQRREHIGRHRRRSPDGEPAGTAALERVDLHSPVGERLERADGIGEEGVARIREPHSSRAAHEELGAEVGLEALQPGRERRLRDEERFGRPAHALPSRRLDEGRDLVQKHR